MHGVIELAKQSAIDAISADRLRWFPDIGVGFYPVTAGAEVYNQAYFNRYESYEQTAIGARLLEFRLGFVREFIPDHAELVDVGIGSGAFIKARPDGTLGFDINPAAIAWLNERGILLNPYKNTFNAASMFDSLEHIEDFFLLLRNVRTWLFVSIPIFKDCGEVMRSKHFRVDEHFWYFTDHGFRHVMKLAGFEVARFSDGESAIGRESIRSYALYRHAVATV